MIEMVFSLQCLFIFVINYNDYCFISIMFLFWNLLFLGTGGPTQLLSFLVSIGHRYVRGRTFTRERGKCYENNWIMFKIAPGLLIFVYSSGFYWPLINSLFLQVVLLSVDRGRMIVSRHFLGSRLQGRTWIRQSKMWI